MSPVYFWRYTLRSARRLNASSARTEHEGALIRIGDGFGCLHPWPELGDPTVDELLSSLAKDEERVSPLVIGAAVCAAADGRARREGRSLFAEPTPESHWLAQAGDDPEFARSEGFTLAKIKAGRDLAEARRSLGLWSAAGLRVRLDFNESLDRGGFLSFWRSLRPEEREAIDAVEDPESWSEQGWMELRQAGVPLAVDREAESRLRHGDLLVYKPARYGVSCQRETRFYITSYMDHAFGQVWAAAFATAIAKGEQGRNLLPCGLLTHRCFEPDRFFERLRCDGPRLLPPGGTGHGFDDLLEGLPWKRLT